MREKITISIDRNTCSILEILAKKRHFEIEIIINRILDGFAKKYEFLSEKNNLDQTKIVVDEKELYDYLNLL